ncbi:hypothetical protein LEP1GSC195_3774 [Leptospira wolbachii serovar Codice str. CDC]|uniref:Uncharacterized protein n=1 Tax=Leptospira wolbachii serovar Codice str. CDC TaxID=1218599 RepID=R9A392_9LEPT|nr:hypothetical protein LEP1GSC195_3774 [Leptospira wolbachii serovar Codice str. CDC]
MFNSKGLQNREGFSSHLWIFIRKCIREWFVDSPNVSYGFPFAKGTPASDCSGNPFAKRKIEA